MHTRIVLLALLTALLASCKGVDCGDGTTERDGICVPSNETIGTAKCGPFTELQGDLCVPMLPPTVCDPSTTEPEVDSMGVTTCIGTGAGGCSATFACPKPATGKQTICGQIYDFENNQPFAESNAMGRQCGAGATSGPCALAIKAYDAVAFATNGGGQLATGAVYIDDCGRYRVPDITLPPPTSPFIALGFDDATIPGPGGVTNATGVATGAAADAATRDLEAFIVRKATSDQWAGGPPALDATHGIFAPIYRGHRTGTDLVAGVQFTFGPMASPPPTMTDINRDFYFAAEARTALNAAANATGVNGTVLVTGANLGEIYSGQGGNLAAGCRWDIHGGASVGFVVFIQIFRPIGATCPL